MIGLWGNLMRKVIIRKVIIRKNIIIGIFCIISTVLFVLGGLYLSGWYLPNQEINGEVYSMQTSVDVWNDIAQQTPILTLTVGEESFEIQDVFYIDGNAAAYKQPFLSWLRREPITHDVSVCINEDALYDALYLLQSKSYDAKIVYTDTDGWELAPEVTGCEFDLNTVYDHIVSAYQADGQTAFALDKYLKKPEVTAKDLQSDYDNVAWLNDFHVQYTNGMGFTGRDLYPYVTDYNLDVPHEFYTELLDALRGDYETEETSMAFTPTDGQEAIVIDYGTFGKSVNINKEILGLQQLIEKHESCDERVPALSGYDEFADTYIEVSIEKQHLWHYVDGVLQSETDVVTGRRNAHDTPTGVYYISECIPGKYLKGDNYNTWVNRWMRLTNSGIGLHDAYWRKGFGGEIYAHNGSHGCVNLPKDYAYALYKEAYVGMPVVIY